MHLGRHSFHSYLGGTETMILIRVYKALGFLSSSLHQVQSQPSRRLVYFAPSHSRFTYPGCILEIMNYNWRISELLALKTFIFRPKFNIHAFKIYTVLMRCIFVSHASINSVILWVLYTRRLYIYSSSIKSNFFYINFKLTGYCLFNS